MGRLSNTEVLYLTPMGKYGLQAVTQDIQSVSTIIVNFHFPL